MVKSRSVKEMRKTRGGWGERPFPSCACLIFALLVSIRPHYTIGEPGTGYNTAKKRTFSCGTNAGKSERARWTHLAHSVSQSERTIRLSARGFIRIIGTHSYCHYNYKVTDYTRITSKFHSYSALLISPCIDRFNSTKSQY